jgi:hypothetical protein
MKINAEIYLPHIYVLTYPTQYELAMSFVRVQEFYESKKFRNKYFTLEDYMDYWCKDHGGSFTYPSTWNGFNVPGDVLIKWTGICGKNGDNLREKEKRLVNLVFGLMWNEHTPIENMYKVYIIGVHKRSKDILSVIDHESAHAFYRIYPEYKNKCNEIISGLEEHEKKSMSDILIGWGYNKKVIPDEIQAYSSTGQMAGFTSHLQSEFKENFNAFKNTLVKENRK